MLAASPCLQFIHPFFLTFCPACSAALAGTATAKFGPRTLRCQDITTATAAGRCCRCQVVIWHWDLHAFFEHGWIADDSRCFFQPWESFEILSLFPCGAFGGSSGGSRRSRRWCVLFLKFRLGPQALWDYTFWQLWLWPCCFRERVSIQVIHFFCNIPFVLLLSSQQILKQEMAINPSQSCKQFVIFEVVWRNWWQPTALLGRFAALRW